ncbi:putative reverse transcriptase domain-containing protein [Tanacetum coccineum]
MLDTKWEGACMTWGGRVWYSCLGVGGGEVRSGRSGVGWRGLTDSSSSTSAYLKDNHLNREAHRKTSLERHEEQIEEILNHLDELSLDRIKNIEDKIEGLGNGRLPSGNSCTVLLQALEAQANNTDAIATIPIGTNEKDKFKCSRKSVATKEFMSCQPINFKGTEGAVRLIRWFERTESVFSCSNCTEDCKDPDKSFVSISLASMLNIPPITIDTFYNIEMADGNLVSTNTVIQGATLTLLNQPFEIDLMPIKLGSFDIVIGMDWLSKYHARIICDEKVIHIPINGETLIMPVTKVKLQLKNSIGIKNQKNPSSQREEGSGRWGGGERGSEVRRESGEPMPSPPFASKFQSALQEAAPCSLSTL